MEKSYSLRQRISVSTSLCSSTIFSNNFALPTCVVNRVIIAFKFLLIPFSRFIRDGEGIVHITVWLVLAKGGEDNSIFYGSSTGLFGVRFLLG